ncbi:MAG: hypothetical protein AAGJ35_14000, partial [Myxococcota bacterium]
HGVLARCLRRHPLSGGFQADWEHIKVRALFCHAHAIVMRSFVTCNFRLASSTITETGVRHLYTAL